MENKEVKQEAQEETVRSPTPPPRNVEVDSNELAPLFRFGTLPPVRPRLLGHQSQGPVISIPVGRVRDDVGPSHSSDNSVTNQHISDSSHSEESVDESDSFSFSTPANDIESLQNPETVVHREDNVAGRLHMDMEDEEADSNNINYDRRSRISNNPTHGEMGISNLDMTQNIELNNPPMRGESSLNPRVVYNTETGREHNVSGHSSLRYIHNTRGPVLSNLNRVSDQIVNPHPGNVGRLIPLDQNQGRYSGLAQNANAVFRQVNNADIASNRIQDVNDVWGMAPTVVSGYSNQIPSTRFYDQPQNVNMYNNPMDNVGGFASFAHNAGGFSPRAQNVNWRRRFDINYRTEFPPLGHNAGFDGFPIQSAEHQSADRFVLPAYEQHMVPRLQPSSSLVRTRSQIPSDRPRNPEERRAHMFSLQRASVAQFTGPASISQQGQSDRSFQGRHVHAALAAVDDSNNAGVQPIGLFPRAPARNRSGQGNLGQRQNMIPGQPSLSNIPSTSFRETNLTPRLTQAAHSNLSPRAPLFRPSTQTAHLGRARGRYSLDPQAASFSPTHAQTSNPINPQRTPLFPLQGQTSINPPARSRTGPHPHPPPPLFRHSSPSSLDHAAARPSLALPTSSEQETLEALAFLNSLSPETSSSLLSDIEEWDTTTPQPSGRQCSICKMDLSFHPDRNEESRNLPVVAILPCLHHCHDECLERITPPDQAKNPPCIACALGEEP